MVDTDMKSGKTALAAALMAVVIGLVVLMERTFQVDAIRTTLHGAVAMKPAAALAFILSGTSLVLSLRSQHRRNRTSGILFVSTARSCALVVTLIGLMSLVVFISGWDFGIPPWLFHSTMPSYLPLPGRTSPNEALNFLLLGGALMAIDLKKQFICRCVEFSAAMIGLGSLVAIFGYAYGAESLYRVGGFVPMTLPAGIAFFVMSVAVLASHTDRGFLAMLAGDNAGGTMARCLLPAAVLVPAWFGWLELHGEQAGFFDSELGNALFALSDIFIFASLICWSANALFRMELYRKKAEEAIRESEEKFRELANNIADAFWITSPDLKTKLYISPGYEAIWGRSKESFYTHPELWSEAILPEDREHVLAVFAGLKGDEPKVSVEYQIVRPDGTTRWVLDRGFQVRADDGSVIRVTGIATDITERKLAEDALDRQQTELRVLFDIVPAMICFKDTENRILRVNKRLADSFGTTVRELEGKYTSEVYPQGATGFYADDLEVINSGKPKLGVIDRVHPSEGTERWIQTDRVPLCGVDDKVKGIVVMVQDITERKKAEEDLRLLNSAVLQSKESIVITDAELDFPGPRIIFTNPAFTSMTGFTAEEARGKTPRILQGELTDKAVLRRLRKSLEMGEGFVGEAINYRKDGTAYNQEWQIAPILDHAAKTTHFVAVMRDITERKKIEARYRQLVESNVQGVLFWNSNGEVTGANDAFLRLVRYTREDLEAGRIDWMALTPPEYAHLDRRALEEIAATGASALYEKEYILEDGTRIPILLAAAAFTDNRNEGVCFVVDLTERKSLEARLYQSQKMETVGKLAGGVAHEFNSILTAIIGQSELLLGDLPAESDEYRSVTEISKAALRAANLTRQLLAYGRKQLLQPQTLDLNSVVGDMEGSLRHLVGQEVDLLLVPAVGLEAVRADAGQLEQVIMNIVLNAHEAMPNGGKITLETANISFSAENAGNYPELKAGDYVMLAITDTGTGMSMEMTARIFEPFFSTKGVGQGTGLGLSTSYGIIKQSGGHISVYSEPARGTTFKIYLPQVEDLPKQIVRQLDSPDLPRGTETILMAEDDPALRKMATALLEKLGYKVFTAANGMEALTLKQQRNIGHIDLLFTDVVMPHMSGKELSERIQALYPHTKILFTSAFTENAFVHQGVLDKGVTLLQKPFTPSVLARKLREVLDQ